MKGACIVLFCMVALAYAAFDEVDDEVDHVISVRTSKKLSGGYTFVTNSVGGGKFKCTCYRGGKQVWAGMCGVKDKSFSYSDCA